MNQPLQKTQLVQRQIAPDRHDWVRKPLPCIHLGPASDVCDLHTRCTRETPLAGVACCATCADSLPPSSVSPQDDVQILCPGLAFNPSIVDLGGRLLLAYRDNHAGSQIHLCYLDDNLQPSGNAWRLHLDHPLSRFGREDPRLFLHRGRVHVQFSGVQGASWQDGVNVLYARLDERLLVEKVWLPAYASRNKLEKNWGPFTWKDELFSVYTPGPEHRVLYHDGDTARTFASVEWAPLWPCGLLRGGAAPVLHDGIFWSFFHGWKREGDRYAYTAGCYTFEARPPFRPLRITPQAILSTNLPHVEAHRGDVFVVFPGGAVLRDGKWLIAYGHRDCEVRIATFDHATLQRGMMSC